MLSSTATWTRSKLHTGGHDRTGDVTHRDGRRGHFPNEQAALKVLYLVATAKRPNRENLTGRINGRKHILNTVTIHYGDRIDAAAQR